MKLDKRLLQQTGNTRLYLGLTIGLGLAVAILIIFQAHFLSQIINEVFLKHNSQMVLGGMLALLAIILLRAALIWGSEVTANRTAGKVKDSLRRKLFAHLLKLGPAYTRGERSGELTSVTMEGVESLDAYFSLYLPQVFLTMLVPALVGVVVGIADPLSGVVLLVTLPVLPLFMILIGKKAEALNQQQFGLLSQLNAHFLDVLQGLTTLKLLGRSRMQAEKISRVSDKFRETTLKVLKVAFLSALIMELGATLSTAIIAVEIGLRLLYNQIPFQSALFVLLLAPEFYLPLRSLGSRFHSSMSAGAASKRIFEILDTPLATSSTTTSTLPVINESNLTINFEAVSYNYENRTALAEVTFSIRPGEKVALVGPSGAGKSTIAALLLRFIEPTAGRISLLEPDGQQIQMLHIPAEEWRAQVGWVPQNPYLFNRTVAENIALARPEASREEIVLAAKQAHAHAFIMALPQGYNTLIGERGARLSGGQAQRLSLARAFLKNAPILIMDEATSNLDSENESLVLDATERLMQGRTVLMITHRPATIARATQVIRLEKGRVVSDTHSTNLLAEMVK